MVKPVAPACGHLGCRHCLAILVSIENVLKCPLCKAPIGKGAALHVNIALDDIIGNFDVNCKNSGCLWTGKFHAHEQHFKYVENLKCSVQIKVAERYWLGRGWQRTFRIVQSRKFLARNAEGRCIGNVLKSMLLLFV